MEYPECPVNFKLTWLENPVNQFVLQCRPYTSEETEVAKYIHRLLYSLYLVPILATGLLCLSCIYSNTRYYRARKSSQLEPVNT